MLYLEDAAVPTGEILSQRRPDRWPLMASQESVTERFPQPFMENDMPVVNIMVTREGTKAGADRTTS